MKPTKALMDKCDLVVAPGSRPGRGLKLPIGDGVEWELVSPRAHARGAD